MKTIENVTIYKCDYCSKTNRRKHVITKHEKFCKKNPNNHHRCFDFCIHLKRDRQKVNEFSEYSRSYTTFTCLKLNKDLFSYQAEKRGLVENLPENFEESERMPLECKFYEGDSNPENESCF